MNFSNFLRRSFRKRSKKKAKNVDHENTRQSVSNFALARGEAERLPAENRRLRQELEFERTRNNPQSNNNVFPQRNNLVSTGQQTDNSETVDSRNRNLEDENRELQRMVQSLEEQIQRGISLKTIEDKIASLQRQIGSSTKKEEHLLARDIKTLQKQIEILHHHVTDLTLESSYEKTLRNSRDNWSRDIAVEDYQSGLQDIKDRLAMYHEDAEQRFDFMENALAKEMKANSLQQQKCNAIPETAEIQKMPPDIKAFAWKLQSYMVTVDKVKHFSLALGVEPIEVERLANKHQATPRTVFWSALCSWFRQNTYRTSLEHFQNACAKAGISVLHNGLMPDIDRLTLEKCYSYLEDNLHPAITLPYLRDEGLLDASDVFYVTSQSTRRERCASILSLLPLFGEQAFETFCDSLTKSGQSHLRETLEGERNRLVAAGQEDTEGTLRKDTVSSAPSLYESSFLRLGGDAPILKILSTLLARTSHMEAMIMSISAESNCSSFSRSVRDYTL